jgi:caa(3)-type oxidase subunit IV
MTRSRSTVDSEHAPAPRAYALALFALLVLLAITVAVAQLELHRFALLAAMVIAIIKAAIVLLVFMELGAAAHTTRAIAVLCLFAAAILGGLSYIDWGDRDHDLETAHVPVNDRVHAGGER